jgi:putative transposase
MPGHKISWPHAPVHELSQHGTYFVTSGTYRKEHHFAGARRLGVLQRGLLSVAEKSGWQIEAWAVFSNHYHFVAHSPRQAIDAAGLSVMLQELHTKTAVWINRLEDKPGRKIWHNFFETRLTHQRSYLARLNYVHQNAVRHKLVPVACRYPWCSAAWFERTAPPAMIKTIYQFKTDTISVVDGFEPTADW